MPEDLSLFGDDPDESAPPAVAPPSPVTDWQVELLRKTLDARGLTLMDRRRELIEQTVGRPVASLRELTSEEAMLAVSTLGAAPRASDGSPSTWDDRDEDTWIDRL